MLVGSFNPAIFQPEWFARQGLLSQEQVDAADVKIIVPEICHFETEQVVLQVTHGRFLAASKQNANPVPLRDLVRGTFFVLEHTPVTALGMNRQMHFPLASEEAWHEVGDRLAPKDGWEGLLEGRPGLASLSMTTYHAEPTSSKYTVRVEPSSLIKFGIYFETNDHNEAPKIEPLRGALKILDEKWEEATIYASRIANRILNWAEAGG